MQISAIQFEFLAMSDANKCDPIRISCYVVYIKKVRTKTSCRVTDVAACLGLHLFYELVTEYSKQILIPHEYVLA